MALILQETLIKAQLQRCKTEDELKPRLLFQLVSCLTPHLHSLFNLLQQGDILMKQQQQQQPLPGTMPALTHDELRRWRTRLITQ